MNRQKWLLVALFISWTLNIALGVALYYRSRPPFPRPEPLKAMMPPPSDEAVPPMVKHHRQRLRSELAPLTQEQRRLTREFFNCLCGDSLDSQRVQAITDSLVLLRSELQRNLYQGMLEMRNFTPFERRHEMYLRILKKFDPKSN